MRTVSMRPLSAFLFTALALAACDGTAAQDGGSRYQQMAENVATIPLQPAGSAQGGSPVSLPLLPARETPNNSPLRVELLSPHQLWDQRNGPLKVPEIEVAEGTTRPVPVLVSSPTAPAAPTPAAPSATTSRTASPLEFRTIQLGAFSSEDAARAAWQRILNGPNGTSVEGLSPQYEPADVNGRQLVRLRVIARQDRAQTLCATVASADPWCARSAATATPSTIFH